MFFEKMQYFFEKTLDFSEQGCYNTLGMRMRTK